MSVAAEIMAAVDLKQVTRAIAAVHVEWQDGERQVSAAERKTESLRDEQRRRRLEMGALLIQAKSGIKHGGWLPYLEKLGIEQQRANDWMREATGGPKSPESGNSGDLTPARAAGVDKKPRKSSPSDEATDDEPAPLPIASWKNDLERALVGIDKMIMGYAASWPKRSRASLAQSLRSIASRIEQLGDD